MAVHGTRLCGQLNPSLQGAHMISEYEAARVHIRPF